MILDCGKASANTRGHRAHPSAKAVGVDDNNNDDDVVDDNDDDDDDSAKKQLPLLHNLAFSRQRG